MAWTTPRQWRGNDTVEFVRPTFVEGQVLSAAVMNQLVAYIDQQVEKAVAAASKAETAATRAERGTRMISLEE